MTQHGDPTRGTPVRRQRGRLTTRTWSVIPGFAKPTAIAAVTRSAVVAHSDRAADALSPF